MLSEVQPVRREQEWAWMVPPASGSRLIVDRVELAVTHVTTTYDMAGAAGAARTTITVRHDDVPVEWVDDLRAWWRYQLAFVEWYAERY